MLRWLSAVSMCGLALAATNAFAVKVEKNGPEWIITTDKYVVHFKTDAQAGYYKAFPAGKKENLLSPGGGRCFYHSANYAGWKDWGPAVEAKEISNAKGKAVVNYVMDDGGSKIYHVTATYWDGASYFKHEVVVEGKAAVAAFGDGHEPMLEPRNGMGAKNKFASWQAPIAGCAFENENGYVALYSPTGQARTHDAWAPDGRMDLVHDGQGGGVVDKGKKSQPIVYYMAVGTGGLKDAEALSDSVTKEPASLAVDPQGKAAATWAGIKSSE